MSTALVVAALALSTTSNVGMAPSPQLFASMCADDAAMVNSTTGRSRLPLYRYLQLPSRDRATVAGIVLGINLVCNRRAELHVPALVCQGWGLRVDLGGLVDAPDELVNLSSRWENLAFVEPYFHYQVLDLKAPDLFSHSDGKHYTTAFAHALHADVGSLQLLTLLCSTKNPVMRADFFLSRALATVNGGIYYDLRGIKGLTFDQWLARKGVDLVKYRAQGGQNRGAIARSLITGKVRWYEVLQGSGVVRPVNGTAWVMVTHDLFDEDVRAETDVFKNLINPKDRARECFSVEESGLPEMYLSDGEGAQQDFVPGNVASDRTVPFPHTTVLQGMISCARCHGPDDFYKMLNNDAARITSRFTVELFDKRTVHEQQALVRGMYGLREGELDASIRLARNSLNDVLVKSLGSANLARPERAIIESMAAMTGVYDHYEYDLVTPRVALREVGVPVQESTGDAEVLELLRKLLPDLPVNAGGLQPEGAYEALLKADVGVNRRLWEKSFVNFALRVRTTIKVSGQPNQGE